MVAHGLSGGVGAAVTFATTARLAGAAVSFSPDDVTGLVAWWDADALTGYSDTDTVTTFTNQASATSGTYDLTVDTGTPSYETAEINSLPAVKYASTGEKHAVPLADGNAPDLTAEFYIAAVFELDSVPTTGPSQTLLDKDTSQYQLGIFRQRPLVYVQGGTAVLEGSPGSVTAAGTAYLLTAYRDSSDTVTLERVIMLAVTVSV